MTETASRQGDVSAGFLRQGSTLSLGIAGAQAILFLATPVLTRIFDPVDFGVFGMLVGIGAALGVAINGRYFLAIVLEKDDRVAASVIRLALLLTVGLSGLLLLLISVSPETWASLLRRESIADLLWVVAVVTLVTGCYDVANYRATREGAFRGIAIIYLIRAVVVVGLQILGGFSGAGVAGLIVGRVAGDVVQVIALLKLQGVSLFRTAVPWSSLRVCVTRHWRFPVFSAPQGLLSAVGQYAPAVLIFRYFDPATAGLYLMAHRILATTDQVFLKGVRQAFYGSIARRPDARSDVARECRGITLRFAVLGTLAAALTMVVGPSVFAFVLGPEWRGSGEIARIIVWIVVAKFVAAPSQMVMLAWNLQGRHLLLDCLGLVLRIGGLTLGGLRGDIDLALTLFTITTVVIVVFQVMVVELDARREVSRA